jgi:F420-non-reducing hydrogenase small subunit
MAKRIKLAIGLGSTCSGCDVAILDLNEKILDLTSLADIVFWPTAMDFKLAKLEAIEKNEDMHIAHLLRERSKVMIAFGSCSCFGGIPGLCNLTSREEIFETVYKEAPSTVNPEFITPKIESSQDGYDLTLPELYDNGRALSQIIDVDYYLPGCPPAVELIERLVPIIGNFLETGGLPPKGTVIASDKTLCDECPLTKEKKMISKIFRPHEIIPDPQRCLLEQGIICMGPATRGGCGAKCINVRMPCRGCMGPTAEVKDQGAKMVSAIASLLGVENEKDLPESDVEKLVDQIKDPVGIFYRFSFPVALINRRLKGK